MKSVSFFLRNYILSVTFFSSLLSHENLHSLPDLEVVSRVSLFTGIDFSSDTAVSSTQLIYLFMSFFICLFILLSLLDIFFQIDCLEPSFTDSVVCFHFRFCFCDSMMALNGNSNENDKIGLYHTRSTFCMFTLGCLFFIYYLNRQSL